jgi:DNA-binding transcriptional regulator YiaG
LGIAQRLIRISYVHNLRKRKQCKPLSTSIKTLGDWIQIKRQKKKLSQYHLAAKMGIATALVHSWENGTCEPNERQRQILGDHLAFDRELNLKPSVSARKSPASLQANRVTSRFAFVSAVSRRESCSCDATYGCAMLPFCDRVVSVPREKYLPFGSRGISGGLPPYLSNPL